MANKQSIEEIIEDNGKEQLKNGKVRGISEVSPR